MSTERLEKIRTCLTRELQPEHLQIDDESHLHVGHAGAKDGRGHFFVQVVSAGFAGIRPLQRHRMVYQALGELMQTDIHALRIEAYAEDEFD